MAPAADVVSTGKGDDVVRRNRFPLINLRNRLTALLADGNAFCRLVEQAHLQSLGLQTTTVDNGLAAVDLIASGASFNIIIMDLLLPFLNGVEVARQMREMGVNCVIVGLAGFNTEREREAFLDAGANLYIERPLDPEFLAPLLLEIDAQLNN